MMTRSLSAWRIDRGKLHRIRNFARFFALAPRNHRNGALQPGPFLDPKGF
jgi:hypothetical protein